MCCRARQGLLHLAGSSRWSLREIKVAGSCRVAMTSSQRWGLQATGSSSSQTWGLHDKVCTKSGFRHVNLFLMG